MPAKLSVSDEALEILRPLFSKVEGSCEVWTDEEILTRMLIRGVMAYGQTAGKDFSEMSGVAGRIRQSLTAS